MKKVWDKLKLQLGLDPWDWEIELRVEQGMERWEATNHVVSRWMRSGNLRPLAAIAKKHGVLRG
jgi:hypothetical protein